MALESSVLQHLPTLKELLQATAWRTLLAIMETHGLSGSNRQRKGHLVRALQEHLSAPTILDAIIAQLTPADQQAIRALLQAGGALPAHRFQERFGPLRDHRPWRKEAPNHKPWLTPVSTSERLLYLGLLFPHPAKPKPGQLRQLLLPAELFEALRTRLKPSAAPAQLLRPLPKPGPSDGPSPAPLVTHLGLWLATMQHAPISLQHGRWLPPTTIADLIQRLELDVPLPCRSERHAPYLAFLHLLAAQSGLIHHGSIMQLTPAAWHWLAQPLAPQLATLFNTLLPPPESAAARHHKPQEPSDAADRFRLPWQHLSHQARSLVRAHLAGLSVGQWVPLAQWVQQMRLQDRWTLLPAPYPERWQDEESPHIDPLHELCRGPLYWLGVLDLAQSTTETAIHLRLTPAGAWLINLPNSAPPVAPPPTFLTVSRGAPDWLLAEPTTPAHLLARAAPYCGWSPAAPPNAPAIRPGQQRLQLLPDRVAQATAHNVPLAQIIADLSAALGQPPSRRLQQRLRQWAAQGQQTAIRTLTVLETKDAELMAQLRRRKLIRRRLGSAIAPNRAIINPENIAPLRQTLSTLNLYPAIDEPAVESTTSTSNPVASNAEEPGEESISPPLAQRPGEGPGEGLDFVTQSLLLQIYQQLGRHIDLPVKIPWEQERALQQHISPQQQMIIDEAAHRVAAQLESNIAGYLSLPAWQMPILPATNVIAIRRHLQTAIQNSQPITLRYWSASHPQPTDRTITPYYLQEQNHADYLIGWCHLRQQERTFRLDRIEHVADAASDDKMTR